MTLMSIYAEGYRFDNSIIKPNTGIMPMVWFKNDKGFRVVQPFSPRFASFYNPLQAPILGYFENKIVDGDMQKTSVSDWVSFGATLTKENINRFSLYTGGTKQSLRVTTSSYQGGTEQTFQVEPGKRYTCYFEVCAVTPWGGVAGNTVGCSMFDHTHDEYLSNPVMIRDSVLPRTGFMSCVAPPGCTEIAVRFLAESTSGMDTCISGVVVFEDKWGFDCGPVEIVGKLIDSGQLTAGASTFNNDVLASYNTIESREVTIVFSNIGNYFSKHLENGYRREILLDRYSAIVLASVTYGYQRGTMLSQNAMVPMFGFKNIYTGRCVRYSITQEAFTIVLREA